MRNRPSLLPIRIVTSEDLFRLDDLESRLGTRLDNSLLVGLAWYGNAIDAVVS
jgi:hypothetical protein